MATFTITPTPGHNVTYGFKDDMFDFESNPPKPALYDAAPDLAERLARSSDGSAHDVAAVARLWDPSCSVHQRIGRPDLLVVQSCTELPDVAKEHIRLASQAAVNIQYEIADPWVKVGTTTIDGDVCGLWESEDLDEMRGRVRFIGGHHLRLEWLETNRGVDIAFCDIVRRQSEIDAERRAAAADGECSSCGAFTHLSTHGTCSRCCDRAENPCPECGPHGNRGEVLLASSWAKCTTCAGGKPGDLWGEVRPSAFPGVKSYTLAIGDLVFDEEVEVQRARVQGAAAALGAALAALRSTMTEATVDMTYDPSGHKPGEVSFTASALQVPTEDVLRYPTEEERRAVVLAKLSKTLAEPSSNMTADDWRERIARYCQ